jgi:multiple sugar transport system substrate-binding protein
LLGAAGALALGSGAALAQSTNVKMRISWWGSDDRHQKTLRLIKLWESRNPGATMAAQYGGLIGYQDKLSTEFAGHNAPDIMQISDNRESLAASGRLLRLDPFVASGQLNLADANKSVLETVKIDGKLFSIPWGLAGGCFFLDTKVFADTGTALPGMEWTWDDYARTARAISKAAPRGMYGSADIWAPAGTRSFYPFEFFLRQRGKTAYTPAGKLNFGAAELTEWFSFWDELRKAGAVPPAEVTALENGFETSPLIAGRAAMYPINSSIASSLQGLTPHKLIILPLPTGIGSTVLPGPSYGPFVNTSMQVYLNAETKFPKLAVDFLNAVTNDAEFAKVQQMSRGVPLSSRITQLLMPDISPIEQSMVEMVSYVQARSAPMFVAWPKAGSQIQDLMQRSHQEIAFGQATIPQTVAKFIDEAGLIIE